MTRRMDGRAAGWPARPAGAILLLALLLVFAVLPGTARAMELEDLAGRKVVLDAPAEKVLLGEGRFLVALSLLQPADPLSRVAGMLNEFERFDPVGFARYAAAFPAIREVPLFGQTSAESVSLETAIALQPDAAVFGLSGHGPRKDSAEMVARLEAAGIPVVFIDFRDDPLANTGPSMRLLGRLLGEEAAAERFAAFHEAEVAKVTARTASLPDPGPNVLLEVHVGRLDNCCFSMARGSYATMIAAAGGRNIASGLLPGAVGMIDLEHAIGADPDVYIGTAIGTAATADSAGGQILLGPGVAPLQARASLEAALQRPGVSSLSALRDGRAYGLWHHFYNSPLNAYALQSIARWLHPEVFADLDPDHTLAAMLAMIRPVDLAGTYATGLPPPGGGQGGQ